MPAEARHPQKSTLTAPPPRTQVLGRLSRLLPGRQGAFWVLFALAVPRVLGAVFTIGLRRFLGPSPSGLFDLAYTPYRFLDSVRNFGTGSALIYERTLDRTLVNTAWTLNVLVAVVVTGIAQIAAGPIAHYYGHPAIEGAFRVLSIAYVFTAITSAHYFLLLRDMDFRARAIPPIGQVIVAGDIAVLFAVWGFGVGVLVARELASVVMGAILLWAIYPFRPRIELVPQLAWKLFRYGAWIGAGLTILYMSQNVDVFVGGRIIHSTRDIGFYTTSWALAFIASGVVAVAASSMVFPALSRLQDDLSALTEKLLTAFKQLGLLMFPASALLAALAPVIVVPLLGEKWVHYRDSFPVLSLLAVYAGNRAMLSIFFEGYKSVGKPWLMPLYNAIKLVVMVPAMIYGAQHGILGLALTYVPIQIVEIPAALILASRVLAISPRAVWRAARVPIAATLVMALAVICTEVLFLADLHTGDTVALVVCLLVGAPAYVGVLLLLDRHALREAQALLLRGL